MIRVVMNIVLRPLALWVMNRRLDVLEARLIDVHARVFVRNPRR